MLPYFLEQLKNTPDDGGTLLDSTVVIYGSPMGDSNLHNHKRVPFFIAGRAGGAIPGGVHLKAPAGTPLANVMLSVLDALGVDDLARVGDSRGASTLLDDRGQPLSEGCQTIRWRGDLTARWPGHCPHRDPCLVHFGAQGQPRAHRIPVPGRQPKKDEQKRNQRREPMPGQLGQP